MYYIFLQLKQNFTYNYKILRMLDEIQIDSKGEANMMMIKKQIIELLEQIRDEKKLRIIYFFIKNIIE